MSLKNTVLTLPVIIAKHDSMKPKYSFVELLMGAIKAAINGDNKEVSAKKTRKPLEIMLARISLCGCE